VKIGSGGRSLPDANGRSVRHGPREHLRVLAHSQRTRSDWFADGVLPDASRYARIYHQGFGLARRYFGPLYCGVSFEGPIRSKIIATAAISSVMQTTIGTA
jgi:hypothetical protein